MSFVRKNVITDPIVDKVFAYNTLAKEAEKKYGDIVINGTIGSLYTEEAQIAAFQTVFEHFDRISPQKKAAYAASTKGNPEYREAVLNWIICDRCPNLFTSVTATCGGTGALALAMDTMMEENTTILIPDLAWSNYDLMAKTRNLKTERYILFEGDHFNLTSFRQVSEKWMNAEGKLFVVINDPCQNPSGYSLTIEEWKNVISWLNELSEKGQVILVNDIAYIDFANNSEAKEYIRLFDEIKENVLVLIAFSLSKTFTSYGLRCGAMITLNRSKDETEKLANAFERYVRTYWSNVNNGAMINFSDIMKENPESYQREKNYYLSMLKERTDLFIQEAKDCGLDIYPYKEGFFVTAVVKDPALGQKTIDRLMERHIYLLNISGGIRVALCSIPLRKVAGLAKTIKECMEEASHD